jgi:hypothetical protein
VPTTDPTQQARPPGHTIALGVLRHGPALRANPGSRPARGPQLWAWGPLPALTAVPQGHQVARVPPHVVKQPPHALALGRAQRQHLRGGYRRQGDLLCVVRAAGRTRSLLWPLMFGEFTPARGARGFPGHRECPCCWQSDVVQRHVMSRRAAGRRGKMALAAVRCQREPNAETI